MVPNVGPEFPVLNTESLVPGINGTSKGEDFVFTLELLWILCFPSRKPVHVAGRNWKAMTSNNLDRLKAQRRGHRGVATKYVQEARALVMGESRDEPVIVRIKSLQSSLEKKLELLKRLNKEILQASLTEVIKGENVEVERTNTKITAVISECRRLVTVMEMR